MKYKLATVVFTDHRLDAYEVSYRKKYAYVIEDDLKPGDMVDSLEYDNRMMVVKVFESDEPRYNGLKLKTLKINKINGVKLKKMEKKSMFSGIIDKYKSQFVPVKEEGVKLSAEGAICVKVGDEYVGFKGDELTSYPSEMVMDIPVYSINRPQSEVRVGDIIKNNHSYGKVSAINKDGSLKVLSFSGYTQNRKEIKDFMLGTSMVRVLISMYNFDTANGFNPFLFAMAEGDSFDAKSLMMLQMMPGAKGMFSNNSFNPMMFAFMDKSGDNSSMMETMMLMSMMNGNSANPFASFMPNITQNAPNTTPEAETAEDCAQPEPSRADLIDIIGKLREEIDNLKSQINTKTE